MKRVLIVNCNVEVASLGIIKAGGKRYDDLFTQVIKRLKPDYGVTCVTPTDSDYQALTSSQMKSYDGVVFSGSAMNIYADTKLVKAQIDLCNLAFECGVPIYGSCWGMQLAVFVAGGVVTASDKGYEIGIATNIQLSDNGRKHPIYQNKIDNFASYCVHRDYVQKLPKDSVLLASNDFCQVQALEIKYKNSIFWGVQYHPEFDSVQARSTVTRLREKVYDNYSSDVQLLDDFTLDQDKYAKTLEFNQHTLEIKNWLDFI